MKIQVNRELCIGSGLCVLYAPGAFATDAEAKAVVIEPTGPAPDSVRTAMNACPTSAITIEE